MIRRCKKRGVFEWHWCMYPMLRLCDFLLFGGWFYCRVHSNLVSLMFQDKVTSARRMYFGQGAWTSRQADRVGEVRVSCHDCGFEYYFTAESRVNHCTSNERCNTWYDDLGSLRAGITEGYHMVPPTRFIVLFLSSSVLTPNFVDVICWNYSAHGRGDEKVW